MTRPLLVALGIACTSLGAVGVVVPGLPTTPFLLAASWAFYKSSPALQRKLLGSPLGHYIRDYQNRGGMTRRAKVRAIALMACMVTLSTLCFIDSATVRIIVVAAGIAGGFTVALLVPEVK